MKTIAYYALHYGREWLPWSIRSLGGVVDEVLIVYTSKPSFGHDTIAPCPETRTQLYYQAKEMSDKAGIRMHWFDAPDRFAWEGQHRDSAVRVCKDLGADIVVVVDADEIWPTELLRLSLAFVENMNESWYRIGMSHLWRSLKWVCNDPAMPVRFHKVNGNGTEQYLPGKVYHMGYAQSLKIVEYKMSIHGHKGELRPEWFETIFKPWSPNNPYGNVHPTNLDDFWVPTRVPDVERCVMEPLVGDHPYWNLDLIE